MKDGSKEPKKKRGTKKAREKRMELLNQISMLIM